MLELKGISKSYQNLPQLSPAHAPTQGTNWSPFAKVTKIFNGITKPKKPSFFSNH